MARPHVRAKAKGRGGAMKGVCVWPLAKGAFHLRRGVSPETDRRQRTSRIIRLLSKTQALCCRCGLCLELYSLRRNFCHNRNGRSIPPDFTAPPRICFIIPRERRQVSESRILLSTCVCVCVFFCRCWTLKILFEYRHTRAEIIESFVPRGMLYIYASV